MLSNKSHLVIQSDGGRVNIHRILNIQLDLHQIEQFLTKWMPDRQFSIEKLIWNQFHLKRNMSDRGEIFRLDIAGDSLLA